MEILKTNTHVHFPPNFSAFDTVEEAIAAALKEGVAAVGISNFYDQTVYAPFREAAQAAGLTPLYGLEFITLDPDLAKNGIRVNDPANPGRMYLCGKGIDPFKAKSVEAEAIAKEIREGNDARAAAMIVQVDDWFLGQGIETGLTAGVIQKAVATRGDVPIEWVSLQERHIARAFQEALDGVDESLRAAVLELIGADEDIAAVDLQGLIRSKLLKSGTPGFVPEVPLGFDQAYSFVLAMGGIPTYPTLADGVDPVCEFETDPNTLAQTLLDRRIFAAELIPGRNSSEAVDAYVKAYTDAGMIVMAGTEHNTQDKIPFEPATKDGPVSEFAKEKFWEAACVVAAHQVLVGQGKPGYVDADGNRTEVPLEDLVAVGAETIAS